MSHKERIPAQTCLRCHVEVDASTCVNDEGAQPADGDINICIYCGHLMAFGADTRLRELNEKERAWCDKSPMVQNALRVRKEVAAVHPDRRRMQ